MKLPKGLFASIIIIVISGLAFTTGFLKENVVTQVEEIKVEVSEAEILVQRMDSRISDISYFDQDRYRAALDETFDFWELVLELELFNDTMSDTERELLLNRMGFHLHKFIELAIYTNIGKMYTHWFATSNSSDYYFATEEIDGYDFYFTKEEFEIYNSSKSLAKEQTYVQFIGSEPYLDYILASGVVPTDYVTVSPWNKWSEFLRGKLFEIEQQIDSNLEKLAELEGKASFFGYGVTLITVTTILAAAMAAQLNDKEREREYSHIKAEIYDDKSMIITKGNNLAIPVLIIALILAALGLLLPLLYGFIF